MGWGYDGLGCDELGYDNLGWGSQVSLGLVRLDWVRLGRRVT